MQWKGAKVIDRKLENVPYFDMCPAAISSNNIKKHFFLSVFHHKRNAPLTWANVTQREFLAWKKKLDDFLDFKLQKHKNWTFFPSEIGRLLDKIASS